MMEGWGRRGQGSEQSSQEGTVKGDQSPQSEAWEGKQRE